MVTCTLHLSKVLNRLEVVRSSENDFFDEKYQCAQKGVKVHIGTFAKTNKEIKYDFDIVEFTKEYDRFITHTILVFIKNTVHNISTFVTTVLTIF